MQIFTWRRLGVAALMLLFISVGLHAQQKIEPVTVIQKATAKDGTKSVVKKRFEDKASLQEYLQKINNDGNTNIEIQVNESTVGNRVITIDNSNKQALFHINREVDHADLAKNMEKMQLELHESIREMNVVVRNGRNVVTSHFTERTSSDRPMLGIYVGEGSNLEGVSVGSLVPGGGARAAGIQGGDVITAINGVGIKNQTELRTELNKYKPGETIDVTYNRAGLSSTTESTLYRSRSSSERDPCEVFIGVSLGGNGPQGKGIHVSNIIGDTPAEKYGIKAGDVITSFDGVTVNSFGELLRERNKHEAGDFFKVKVERDGQLTEITAQFMDCEEEMEEELAVEELEEEVLPVITETIVPKEEPALPQTVIDNTLELNDYQAFPNPTYGQFNLRFSSEAVPTLVRVIDVNGKVVYKENINQFDGYYNKSINLLNNAAPGTLFLQVIQGQKISTEKIVLVPRA